MIPDLKKTFRWFGLGDPVSLGAILQTGAKEVVTALHHISCGDDLDKRRNTTTVNPDQTSRAWLVCCGKCQYP